jgi:hypothetical protein
VTEKQKKIALIVGTIVIALILLLTSRKGAGTTIVNQEEMAPINVSIPAFNIPERGGITINIPALPTQSQYGFNAISPCMCNGASTSSGMYNGPLVTNVFNAGDSGPNIFNYNSGGTTPRDTGFYGVYNA